MRGTLAAQLAAFLLSAAGAGCEAEVSTPPATCDPKETLCHHEPIQGRDLVLVCNDGQVDGAIWLVEDVCSPEEVCRDASCVAR